MVHNILIHLLVLSLQKNNFLPPLSGGFFSFTLHDMSPKEFLHMIVSALVENTAAIEIDEKHDDL